ncbi:Disrupted in schizophrenia 1 protein [Fukomys damarensis]|uniref:Disrupted in schizophrenia 1 protein n=1 Tax=Fukomys damarensis TaxID=885580 RepID=A0A091DVE2_FUKDA|nr:Disrupted in schizophrenia 1 protein [Fukomys damarensis]
MGILTKNTGEGQSVAEGHDQEQKPPAAQTFTCSILCQDFDTFVPATRGHGPVLLEEELTREAGLRTALLVVTMNRASSDGAPGPLGSKSEPITQDSLHEALGRRHCLLQEKQQLQKEVEALEERMSVLEAKDQQLRREIEEQERELQWQGCGLAPLVVQLPRDQLQEVSEALRDTLASASQIPFYMEPPEAIRRCYNAPVLPSLPHGAVGSHFCTAKDLTEEIRTLTSEREGLEPILGRLWTLRSRTAGELGSVVEDHSRLTRELQLQEAVHKASSLLSIEWENPIWRVALLWDGLYLMLEKMDL